MKNGIRSMFGLKKKSSKKSVASENNSIQLNQVYSPSSSVASFSSSASSSNGSAPQTPTHASMQENRGIFRTLEPVWYFQSNLIQQQQSNNSEWTRFDDYSQYALETSLNSKPECILQQSSLGPCTILFRPLPSKPLNNKKARHSMMTLKNHGGKEQFASMPTLPRTATPASMGRTFELNKQIRRTISPVWWFEQDSADGSKGMCRFDYKNQVRLEALSEGRTRLVLTDDAFNVPFTVVLEAPKQREAKEEVRGFLYFEPVSSAFQIAYNSTRDTASKFNDYIDIQQQEELYMDDEQWGASLNRRFSV